MIRPLGYHNLHLLTGGNPQQNTSELLTSERLQVLDEVLQSFAFVVIDSPPVGPVSDACSLAHHVNQVVFVVGADQSNAALVKQALDTIRETGVRVMGAVLNGVDLHRSAYYYAPYYSHEYRSYYQVSETTTNA